VCSSDLVGAGTFLRGVASACIDVSDGLLADLEHLCRTSDVGARIDADALPLSSALLTLFDADARELALSGGDDYELCFTAPAEQERAVTADLARLGCGATRIGRIVAGAGVTVHDAQGHDMRITRTGWDHFHS
jgi:thiamine-monophosphate kinase